MQIRRKLTLQFVALAAAILFLSLFSVYTYSSLYRKMQFGNRLSNRAKTNAKFFVDVKEFDISTIRLIDQNTVSVLPFENIFIFSTKGNLLYCNKILPYFVIQPEWVNQVSAQSKVFYQQSGFEIVGLHFVGTQKDCIVFAGAIDHDGNERVRNLTLMLIAVFVVGVIVMWIAGWVYAGRALAPISGMIDQTDKITLSNLNNRLKVGAKKDELSNLAATINKLLDRLSEASAVQQKFLANAAHELRTPLTVLMGQIEVALMSERTNDYYRRRLEALLDDIVGLKEAANQLLALAQVSADESQIIYTKLSIEEIVLQSYVEVLRRWSNAIVNMNLNMAAHDSEKTFVSGNEVMLRTALLNLLENACKFSVGKPIDISLDREGAFVHITIQDHGIGIMPDELEHIFQPFFRGKNTGEVQGSGMGLSVVDKIIKLHNGSISVKSEVEQGTTFVITLPVTLQA
ncbi:MAG: HAMP domain-containing sensor histidine kinase [Bacteroidota bacterium]